jgi:hypothetical protein
MQQLLFSTVLNKVQEILLLSSGFPIVARVLDSLIAGALVYLHQDHETAANGLLLAAAAAGHSRHQQQWELGSMPAGCCWQPLGSFLLRSSRMILAQGQVSCVMASPST